MTRVVICTVVVLSLTSSSLGNAGPLTMGPFLPHHVLPISGTAKSDFPLSSTFGPRLKASEGYRYDFHRGIDIPAPRGTAVRAIADGVVRLAGDYPSYSDTLVRFDITDRNREEDARTIGAIIRTICTCRWFQ